MFGKKLIIVAAAVALAMGHVAAMEEAAHVKVSAHHHKVVSHKAQHHKKTVVAHKAMRHHKQVPATPAPAEAKGGDDDEDDESDSEESAEDEEETPDVEIDILAGGNNATSTESHHDHSEEEVSFCLPNWTEVSVEGVEDIFCVEGQVCVDQIKDGACPSQQAGLPLGSYCDIVKTGVYGCKPVTKEMTEHENSEFTPVCTGEGESPMSVEGVEGVFCVTGQACVADIKDGACPVAQEGLEFGAYCGKVKTGVYGCKPMTKDTHEHGHGEETEETEETVVDIDVCTGEGESPMSVEGVEGVFCVTGQACVADIKDGACPDAQEGLEFGAYCGTVKTGVYGCKPKSKDMHEHEQVPTEHADAGADESDDLCTGEGESPMSVEGVEGVFCVTGQACVADIKDGACPAEQDGLQWGAYCDKVKTGVYGCKPVTEEMYNEQHAGDDHEEGDAEVDTGAPECKGEGQSPMSVEGVEGIFCVTGQACVADIDGACPAAQEGLEFGAHCGTVASGVKGCKPNTSKHMMKMFAKKSKAKVTAKHHAKKTTAAKKGHSIKVVKVHAAKKTVQKKTPVVAKKTVHHQKKTHKKTAHHKTH